MLDETGGARLELNGAFNFRDLGGYVTKDRNTLRTGLLFRSDDLWRLDDSDISQLMKLRLKSVIDLRSENEVTTRGFFPVDKFPIDYINISLADVSADP